MPIVLFETPKTSLLDAKDPVFSCWNVWFLSVLFTINIYLPTTPFANPVMEDEVDPVIEKRDPSDIL